MNELVKPAPAQALAEFMQGVLRDPNVPADKLDALWRMRKELLAEEHREAYDSAFAAMHAELPQVRKDGKIELTKDGKKLGLIPFARWEDMDKIIRPILAKYGFALHFTTVESAGKLLIRGELTREGHSRTADIPLPPDVGPGRNALQAVGSALSYGKRYATEMLLNIVRCGEDDDGNTAVNAGPISAAQEKQLADLIKKTKTDLKKFLEWTKTGVEALKDIPAREHVRLLNALNEKDRRQAEEQGTKPKRGGSREKR
jgi:hypothetical protein